jgi:hypothetical protein
MFYPDWVLEQLARERRRDLVRQLEQDRLARLADSVRPQRGHTVYHALDLVGRQLIALGEHLRARHAAVHARSLLHTSRGQS